MRGTYWSIHKSPINVGDWHGSTYSLICTLVCKNNSKDRTSLAAFAKALFVFLLVRILNASQKIVHWDYFGISKILISTTFHTKSIFESLPKTISPITKYNLTATKNNLMRTFISCFLSLTLKFHDFISNHFYTLYKVNILTDEKNTPSSLKKLLTIIIVLYRTWSV